MAGHSIALLFSDDQTLHGIDHELFIADTSVVLPLVFTPCDRVHIIRSLAAKHESRIANFDSQRTGDDVSFAEWLDVWAFRRAVTSGMPGISIAAALIAPPTRAYCQQELPCKTISFLKSRRAAASSAWPLPRLPQVR
ncbi:hypothetical protein PCAR4_780007 [Paraburkholderia caribensis]|nr:hypothetical protein PCAR4_780007 [Paraburkholderia caribensis]